MVVGDNTVVTLLMVIADKHGEVLNDIHERTPFRFVFGEIPFCPGLHEGIRGLEPGQEKRVIVTPEQAFGVRRKDLVERVRAEDLPEGAGEVGNQVRRFSNDGSVSQSFLVTGHLDDWVYLDGNHPWAGKELHYQVKIVSVAPDSPSNPKVRPLHR